MMICDDETLDMDMAWQLHERDDLWWYVMTLEDSNRKLFDE